MGRKKYKLIAVKNINGSPVVIIKDKDDSYIVIGAKKGA